MKRIRLTQGTFALYFRSKKPAALAYDKAVIRYFGEFARTNF